MSKSKIIIIILATVIIIVLALVLIWTTLLRSTGYSAVYLRTGDLYFGKVTKFPSFGLKNVYLIQTNVQNQENPLSIQKFDRIFWGPKNFLKINRDQVVWTASLNPEGELAKLITENPELIPPPGGATPPANNLPVPNETPSEVPE